MILQHHISALSGRWVMEGRIDRWLCQCSYMSTVKCLPSQIDQWFIRGLSLSMRNSIVSLSATPKNQGKKTLKIEAYGVEFDLQNTFWNRWRWLLPSCQRACIVVTPNSTKLTIRNLIKPEMEISLSRMLFKRMKTWTDSLVPGPSLPT